MTAPEQAPCRGKNDHYAISIRQEAVRLVESGLSQQAVRQQFGVGHMTLLAWLQRYGTAVYAQMRRKLFTAAQKQHIARELFDGRLSEDEALFKYELRLASGWPPTEPASRCGSRPSQTRPLMPVPHLPRSCGRRNSKLKRYTLIDQAEATCKIDIRKKAGAKPSN